MLLAICYDDLPPYTLIRDKLLDLKSIVDAERKPWYLEIIVEFPHTPTELPETVFQHAYGTEQPVAKHFEGINAIGDKHIPLRGNSRLLKKTNQADDHITFKDLHTLMNKGNTPPPTAPQPPMCGNTPGSSCGPAVMPIAPPSDPQELELYMEYQRKVMTLRTMKLNAQTKHEPPTDSNLAPMTLMKQEDGFLVLTPRGRVFGAAPAANVEHVQAPLDQGKSKLLIVEPKAEDASDSGNEPGENGDALDAFAKASLSAFRKRKGAPSSMKNAVGRPKKVGKPKHLLKLKTDAERHKAKAKAKAKDEHVEAAPVAKKEQVEIGKKDIKGAMPKIPSDGSNPAPVRHNGGVIYCCMAQKTFRVLTTAGDKYTEKKAKFEAKKPTASSWMVAIGHIDKARKSVKD